MSRMAVVWAAGLALAAAAARADYELPRAAEQRWLVAAEWELARGASPEAFRLEARRDGRSLSWRIDLFWLADRVDSDSICTGSHRAAMGKYLDRLIALPKPRPALLVELVAAEARGALFVAGLWVHDPARTHQRACQVGAPMLKLDPAGVKALTPEGFAGRVAGASDETWSALLAAADPSLLYRDKSWTHIGDNNFSPQSDGADDLRRKTVGKSLEIKVALDAAALQRTGDARWKSVVLKGECIGNDTGKFGSTTATVVELDGRKIGEITKSGVFRIAFDKALLAREPGKPLTFRITTGQNGAHDADDQELGRFELRLAEAPLPGTAPAKAGAGEKK